MMSQGQQGRFSLQGISEEKRHEALVAARANKQRIFDAMNQPKANDPFLVKYRIWQFLIEVADGVIARLEDEHDIR